MKKQKRSIKQLIGKGYNRFWNFRGRYLVVKGSRGSKKTKTTAIRWIMLLKKYPEANLLCVRQFAVNLADSVRAELVWAIKHLGLEHEWNIPKSNLTITHKKTGQKILFRGMDDPLKITGITVDTGTLCWCWIEEAYQIMKEADFDVLDESIRGETSVFKQIVLTFNPWHKGSWLRRRFFEREDDEGNVSIVEDPDILALTTTYKINEFLDKADLRLFERMKENNPKRYQVAGLGNWGVSEGLIYENYRFEVINENEIFENNRGAKVSHGLDYGYSNDPCYFNRFIIDLETQRIWVPWYEISDIRMSNKKLYSEIVAKGCQKESITADGAEPKSNDELRSYGLYRLKGARKGKDSINNGIQFIQDFEIIIDPRNTVFAAEIQEYSWAVDRHGKQLEKPVDMNNHGMDAMRYALEEFTVPAQQVQAFNKNALFRR